MMCAAAVLPAVPAVGAATESAAPFVATPWSIVDEVLTLAEVGARDFVVDLGSGDGRLTLTQLYPYRVPGR